MRKPVTVAQHRILAAAAVHKHGRVVGGDPRSREILSGLKYIEVDGYDHGPLFKITATGRAAAVFGYEKTSAEHKARAIWEQEQADRFLKERPRGWSLLVHNCEWRVLKHAQRAAELSAMGK